MKYYNHHLFLQKLNFPDRYLLLMDTNKIYKYYFFIIMYIFVVVAVLKIISLIVSPSTPDFKESIEIGERGALFIAVITGLAFTYADALDDFDSSKKNEIIRSGEAFFKSFLTFIIGMIFSIGIRSALMNTTNPFGLPETVLYFEVILMLVLFIVSLITILISGGYFAIGITGLLASFRRE